MNSIKLSCLAAVFMLTLSGRASAQETEHWSEPSLVALLSAMEQHTNPAAREAARAFFAGAVLGSANLATGSVCREAGSYVVEHAYRLIALKAATVVPNTGDWAIFNQWGAGFAISTILIKEWKCPSHKHVD